MFHRHIDFIKPKKLSAWRKIAIGTWRTSYNPQVYGIMDMDAEPIVAYVEKLARLSGERVTLTHVVGKIMAEMLKRHPHVNSVLRFGQLYRRKQIDIFFHVLSDESGKDLSGLTIRNADQKSPVDFAREMADRVQKIRGEQDETYRKVKGVMDIIPGWAIGWFIQLNAFIQYDLNIWSPLFGIPRDSFGSVMVTNVGSLGLEMALAPLVAYSRSPVVVAMGAVSDIPVVRDGQVVVQKNIRLTFTFDHRMIDGVHAAKANRTIRELFANPEAAFGS